MMTGSGGCGGAAVNRNRLLDRLVSLCRIPGPSGNEKKVADFIMNAVRVKGDGAPGVYVFPEASIPGGGNTADILVTVPGSADKEPVLLSAHMDTVPVPETGEIPVVYDNGILRTDGSCVLGGDDRAGVAAALEMMDLALEFPGLHGGIELLFTVQEELGCLGSKDLDTSVIKSRFGYNLDGETPPGTLIVRAPHKVRFTCHVRGKSAHAALAPEEGISAVRIAGRIIDRFPHGRVDGETTVNIGMIKGGGQTNVVPDHVVLTGEMRSFSRERLDKVRALAERIAEDAAAAFGGSVRIEWEDLYQGYSVDESHGCIGLFRAACERSGAEPELLTSPGGGDSNNLNALGITDAVFGLGMHSIHTPKEYMITDEYFKAVDILKEILFCL